MRCQSRVRDRVDQGAKEAARIESTPIACGHGVKSRREAVEETGVYLTVEQLETLRVSPVYQYG